MSIQIRSVCHDELVALLNLYTHLNPNDAPLPDETALHNIWHDLLSDPKVHCFVADSNDEVVGSCTLIIIPNLTRGARPYGLIENVVTHAGHRRKGIGTQLLHHALQTAWNNNCYKVMLLTGSKEQKVHDFYEQAGFKKGIKTGFVAHP
jgi:GNAT superfamily N-acetyltransferase